MSRGFAGGLLENGMNAGGLAAILMTLFLRVTEGRRSRMEIPFDLSELPKIRGFLVDFSSKSGWGREMANRLAAATEETLLTLGEDAATARRDRRRLVLTAQREATGAVLELSVAPGGKNLQDRVALLREVDDNTPVAREVSLRLLRHLASSVKHRQYHDTDIVTVRVEAPGAPTLDASATCFAGCEGALPCSPWLPWSVASAFTPR